METARLLLELLRQRERAFGPLIVFDSDTLPETAPELIERACAVGRPVLSVRFAESDGNGRLLRKFLKDDGEIRLGDT